MSAGFRHYGLAIVLGQRHAARLGLDIDDAVQSAALGIVRAREDLRPGQGQVVRVPGLWALHEMQEVSGMRRKKTRHPGSKFVEFVDDVHGEASTPDPDVALDVARLAFLIERLSENWRAVMALTLRGESEREIAAALRLPHYVVSYRRGEARRALRGMLVAAGGGSMSALRRNSIVCGDFFDRIHDVRAGRGHVR